MRLALYSHAVLKETREPETIAYGPVLKGTLKVFSEQETMNEAIAVSQSQVPLGLNYRRLSTAECVAMVPALEPRREQLAGGIHYPDEEAGDCFAFTKELARICAERGVRFQFDDRGAAFGARGRAADPLETTKGGIRADAFVLAAGAESPLLARDLGVRLPILPVKGYSLTFPRSLWPEAPDGRCSMRSANSVTRPWGQIACACRALPRSRATTPSLKPTAPRPWRALSWGFFRSWKPASRSRNSSPSAALRPVTPKGLPIIGRSPIRNLFFNVGQGHLGWTLAHGSARLAADAITGRPSAIAVDAELRRTGPMTREWCAAGPMIGFEFTTVTDIKRDLTRTTLALLFLGALIFASLYILKPFLPAIVWATMIVIATWPILLKVQRNLWGSRILATIVMTLMLLLVLIIPLRFRDGVDHWQCR